MKGNTSLNKGGVPQGMQLISVFRIPPQVTSGRGEVGAIESAFGLSGKFKVSFPGGIAVGPRTADDNVLLLQFKRYLHDPDKRRRPKQ